MTDHPPTQELEQYWRRALPPATFLAVHRHVATCPRCAEQSSPQQLARDFEDLRASLLPATDSVPYHLSATEVAAYRLGELSDIDLEIAESHLVTCGRCRDEAQMPAVAAADLPDAPERTADKVIPFFSRGWQAPFRQSEGSRPWRVAAVVFAAAFLILMALFFFRTKIADRSEQAVRPENANHPQGSVPVNNRAVAVPKQGENLPNNAGGSPPAPPVDNVALPAPQFVVDMNDGGQRVTLDSRGELGGLERLPGHVRQAVKAALQAGRVERPPAIVQLTGTPSTLLGGTDNGVPFQLISPVGQVVESERPMFSWSTLAGARSYTVSVTDADLNEVAASPPLAGTEWRMTKSLRRGGIYSWQVTALKDGKAITSPVLPAPQAKFKVVDHETLETLWQAKRSYQSSHLAVGVLYAQAGLLTEAEQELRALVRANPRDRTAREILRSVQAMR